MTDLTVYAETNHASAGHESSVLPHTVLELPWLQGV